MPRLPRIWIEGVPQHVVQRGVDRAAIFFHDDDYSAYLANLTHYQSEWGVQIHSYCLMTNHIHLLASGNHSHSIPGFMKAVNQRYVQYINGTYRRSGTLWEGRYKASLIESERYFLACMRYIDLNPVRARMVAHAEDYCWSSYRANAAGKRDDAVHPHPLYLAMDENPERRLRKYGEFVDQAISQDELDTLRAALHSGRPTGSDAFAEQIEQMSGRRVVKRPAGRPKARAVASRLTRNVSRA